MGVRLSRLEAGTAVLALVMGLGGAIPRAEAQAGRLAGGAADEGASMYRGYCAPCHGAKGLGDGPVAAALRTRPTDLSRLAAGNKGQFPAQRVAMVLEFGVMVPAHGSTDMPTWGDTFRVMGDESLVRQRVAALTRHLETLQVK